MKSIIYFSDLFYHIAIYDINTKLWNKEDGEPIKKTSILLKNSFMNFIIKYR